MCKRKGVSAHVLPLKKHAEALRLIKPTTRSGRSECHETTLSIYEQQLNYVIAIMSSLIKEQGL